MYILLHKRHVHKQCCIIDIVDILCNENVLDIYVLFMCLKSQRILCTYTVMNQCDIFAVILLHIIHIFLFTVYSSSTCI